MHIRKLWLLSLLVWSCQGPSVGALQPAPTLEHPILFVTQVPVRQDFTTIGSTFGNHMADLQSVARGGDLWIRYPDGTLKNLTRAAGFGMEGFQGANAIAVRDPAVHWDGKKALFSMVIGAPTEQYQVQTYHWQIYEISGLGKNETPSIRKVERQPAQYNNISPIYGTDDRILFTSDRPRGGEAHLYPQLDEYEEAPVVSGLWSIHPTTGELKLLNHAPSGNFTPTIDSFGRVVFTQWDHLQRDQQADADRYDGADYGTFNYSSEAANASKTQPKEVFPEPRADEEAKGTFLNAHSFNQFFPWTIREDGTEGETLNHIGRHELHGYLAQSYTNDPELIEYYGQTPRTNTHELLNFFQIREDPTRPGCYVGTDAPEFGTHAAGQLVGMCAPPGQPADSIQVNYHTHRDTFTTTEPGKTPSAHHSGHYRDPLPLQNGILVAAHSANTFEESDAEPSRFTFRLKTLHKDSNGWLVADRPLTQGIRETVSYWDPDQKVTFSGELWEWQAVEVRSTPRPRAALLPLPGPEMQVFAQAGVRLEDFQAYLKANNLAVAVVRNVTSRDSLDRQQPYNLRVPGGVQSSTGTGKVYDVTHLQLFQADQIRGLGGTSEPRPGRRVLAQPLHDVNALRLNGSAFAEVAADGSVAAFMPVNRATTWQLTDASQQGVVRERYWLTFQAGEVRVCSSCHGLSSRDQLGGAEPQNPPQALYKLLINWKGSKDQKP